MAYNDFLVVNGIVSPACKPIPNHKRSTKMFWQNVIALMLCRSCARMVRQNSQPRAEH